MMHNTITTATGSSFSKLQPFLDEEQKAVMTNILKKVGADTADFNAELGQQLMMPAMGKVLGSLSDEQRERFETIKGEFIEEHVMDDNTRCFILHGTTCYESQLQLKSKMPKDMEASAEAAHQKMQVMVEAGDQEGAQKFMHAQEVEFKKMATSEFAAAQKIVQVKLERRQAIEKLQQQVALGMTDDQNQLVMGHMQEAQQKEAHTEKAEVMHQAFLKLVAIFSKQQAEVFSTGPCCHPPTPVRLCSCSLMKPTPIMGR